LTMIDWTRRYVDTETSSGERGGDEHGTFYAVCQGIFLVFCFRYRQFVSVTEGGEVKQWNLGHIIHSRLNPLCFVNRRVAFCFASICRSLQLVYCHHLLNTTGMNGGSRQPFEGFFPFDSLLLPRCSTILSPLRRRFSPLLEVGGEMITIEMKWNGGMRGRSKDRGDEEEEMEPDDFLIVEEYKPRPSMADNLLRSLYASSPGTGFLSSSTTASMMDL